VTDRPNEWICTCSHNSYFTFCKIVVKMGLDESTHDRICCWTGEVKSVMAVLTMFKGSNLWSSTNLQVMIWLTSFADTGRKTRPTANSWCRMGIWAKDVMPPVLSWMSALRLLGKAEGACNGIGVEKVDTKVGITMLWLMEGSEAAKDETWASS